MPLDLSAFTSGLDEYKEQAGMGQDLFRMREQAKRRAIAMELQKRMAEEQMQGMPIERDFKRAQAEYQTAMAKEAMARIQQMNDPTIKNADKLAKAESLKEEGSYPILHTLNEKIKRRIATEEAPDIYKDVENVLPDISEKHSKLFYNKDKKETDQIALEALLESMGRSKGVTKLQDTDRKETGANTRADKANDIKIQLARAKIESDKHIAEAKILAHKDKNPKSLQEIVATYRKYADDAEKAGDVQAQLFYEKQHSEATKELHEYTNLQQETKSRLEMEKLWYVTKGKLGNKPKDSKLDPLVIEALKNSGVAPEPGKQYRVDPISGKLQVGQ